jgi:hypothetical protein
MLPSIYLVVHFGDSLSVRASNQIFFMPTVLNLDLFGFDWMGLFSGGGFSSIFFSGVF